MDKSADAFRTISEVAEHLDTPAHVLRFWESRFPQIKPVKRAGGRRYYRPSDVALLTGIKRLLHNEGMTIRGVQKILREQGVRHVAGLSGDLVGDGGDEEAVYIDHDDVVQTAEVAPFRPAPGLAAAMAKAVDHGNYGGARPLAPSMPLPSTAPAQGTLLLTPVAVQPLGPVSEDGDQTDAAVEPEVHSDQAAAVANPPVDETDRRATLPVPQTALPPAPDNEVEFGDDDFEEAPTVTLASRVRALLHDAPSAKAGPELVIAVARLQALRNMMADVG